MALEILPMEVYSYHGVLLEKLTKLWWEHSRQDINGDLHPHEFEGTAVEDKSLQWISGHVHSQHGDSVNVIQQAKVQANNDPTCSSKLDSFI